MRQPRESEPAIRGRSTDPRDYQHAARPVAAMAKDFGHATLLDPHAHLRDQLLYAVEGTMRIRTEAEMWIVPPDRAVYVPGGVTHSVAMRGRVAMRTLYIEPAAAPALPASVVLLEVSELLRALVLALLDEPVDYDPAGRGGRLAALVIDELARARRFSHAIPMPRDRRLDALCRALLDEPARDETLEGWAAAVGASPRTISRLFKADVGLPFTAWRQRVRFHSALEALARGAPVATVARQSGYASPSAFAAAFRRALGVTPSSLAG